MPDVTKELRAMDGQRFSKYIFNKVSVARFDSNDRDELFRRLKREWAMTKACEDENSWKLILYAAKEAEEE